MTAAALLGALARRRPLLPPLLPPALRAARRGCGGSCGSSGRAGLAPPTWSLDAPDPAGLLPLGRVGPPLERPDAPCRVLIVWHSRTGMAEQLARALERGARAAADEMEEDLVIDFRRASSVQVDDLLHAQGFLFCAPENLASLSGAMKEFFDCCYYGALGRIVGKPYGLVVSAGTDGEGAARQTARICQGWRLKQVADPLIFKNGAQTAETVAAPKSCPAAALARCEELGGVLAASALLGG
mmetsp:Transcript_24608/g.82378  ORF Transcript_24608/g.82378 Transcript_24608/m.82378 type:complete len:242 (+) Transcript_24608:99-824(+)